MSFSLEKVTNKRDVRVMTVSCCLGGQGRSPKLDSIGKSSSKHKVTEEINYQFARRISYVATTTDLGSEILCRLRRYVSTLRKQGADLLQALYQTLLGHPLLPAFSTPF